MIRRRLLMCFIANISAFTLAYSASVNKVLPFVSSCSEFGKEEWLLSHDGTFVKSWLRSIVPDVNNDISDTHKNSSAKFNFSLNDFNDDYKIIEVTSSDGTKWLRHGGNERTNGWMYGPVRGDEFAKRFSPDDHLMAFVYPDFSTAIVGKYQYGILKEGYAARIVRAKCHSGVIHVNFIPSKETRSLRYEKRNRTFLTNDPTLMDPYDRRAVKVDVSTLENTGEGLFAKRSFLPGDLIATYSGVKVFDENSLAHENMTMEEKQNAHKSSIDCKNLITFNGQYSIDIPPRYSDIVTYRASLGHKANHKFDANADFDFFTSPRFGKIRCVVATRFIKKGEEIFADYGYDINADVPEWYKMLYETNQKTRSSIARQTDVNK